MRRREEAAINRPVTDVVGVLRESFLFGTLDATVLRELETEIDLLNVPGGDTLIRQGDVDDCLYVLLHGRLRALVEHPDLGPEVVGEIARGESVGEMAVLTGAPRSATVRAARDSQVLRLSKRAFERLLERSPTTATHIARILVNRLRQTLHSSAAPRPPATIAIVPARKDLALADFARALTASLATMARAQHVDSASIDEHLGGRASQAGMEHPDSPRMLGWLNELEARNAFVVYEADPDLTAWTRRCLRQADRVLIVTRAGSEASQGDTEREFWRVDALGRAEAELVVLHEAEGVPTRTAPWLAEPRRFVLHHHVRSGVDGDVQRVARLLAGRAVGLALGGGGARAFAHIGVIRAFREGGIPIDLIGGTSMGGVMAAQVAAGWDVETMLEVSRRAFVKSGSLFDYTLPFMSLIGGHHFIRLLGEMFKDLRVEDLWLKYFCISTNLTQARMVVHDTGPLARWLCATISVPGLAPPVFHAGDLLVDGSLLDTVPSDVIRRFRRGPVVAVDVTAPVDVAVDPVYGTRGVNPTAWEILWDRVNPFNKKRLPSIYKILLRSTMLSSEVERIRADADLYIRPPVEQFDLLEWKSFDRIVDLGYRTACEQLTEWARSGGAPPRPL